MGKHERHKKKNANIYCYIRVFFLKICLSLKISLEILSLCRVYVIYILHSPLKDYTKTHKWTCIYIYQPWGENLQTPGWSKGYLLNPWLADQGYHLLPEIFFYLHPKNLPQKWNIIIGYAIILQNNVWWIPLKWLKICRHLCHILKFNCFLGTGR